MNILNKLILLLLFVFILIGCSDKDIIPVKKFLFDNPNIKLRLNKEQFTFDKYTTQEHFDLFFRKANGEILTVYITDGTINKNGELLYSVYELLLSTEPKRIGDTNFIVQYGNGGWLSKETIFFRVSEAPKQETIVNEEVKKEVKTKGEGFMSLSLGTWIMLIIAMLIVAKIAHKITLKTIFRPTKKSVKKIKTEWEES